GPPSSVQTSYYAVVNGILGFLLAILVGIAPLLRWRVDQAERVAKTIAGPLAFAFLLATVAVMAGGPPPPELAPLCPARVAPSPQLLCSPPAPRPPPPPP